MLRKSVQSTYARCLREPTERPLAHFWRRVDGRRIGVLDEGFGDDVHDELLRRANVRCRILVRLAHVHDRHRYSRRVTRHGVEPA